MATGLASHFHWLRLPCLQVLRPQSKTMGFIDGDWVSEYAHELFTQTNQDLRELS